MHKKSTNPQNQIPFKDIFLVNEISLNPMKGYLSIFLQNEKLTTIIN
jgi:hypothetical protein